MTVVDICLHLLVERLNIHETPRGPLTHARALYSSYNDITITENTLSLLKVSVMQKAEILYSNINSLLSRKVMESLGKAHRYACIYSSIQKELHSLALPGSRASNRISV